MRHQRSRTFRHATSDTDPSPTSSSYDGTNTKAVTFYTSPLYIGDGLGALIVLSCPATGAPSFTATLELCVDESQAAGGEEPDGQLDNWIVGAAFRDPASGDTEVSHTILNATTVGFELVQSMARWVRVKLTRTSGTGTFTIRAQIKGAS